MASTVDAEEGMPSIVDGTATVEDAAAGIVESRPKTEDPTSLVTEKSREFPWGDSPSLGPQSTVNPFHEPKNKSIVQLIKTILLLPLFLVRVLCLVTLMAFGYVLIRLSLLGVSDPLFKPFNRFRRASLWTVRLGARAVLFTMGYYYIPVKGRPAHRSEAPIIVCNHISFVDPIFVFYRHLPVIVSAKENVEMPIVGVFLKALQIIPVDRVSAESRHHAAGNIRRRAMDNKWPHVMLFPEGTTTNGQAIISFKTGAFSPGLPVQPMIVRYPHKHVNPCWADQGGPLIVLFQLMTQFVNFMEVEYLPVVVPTLKEVEDPHEYAERVRHMMASHLGVSCTDHNFVDVRLALAARKLNQPAGQSLVEFARMEKLFHLDFATAQNYLAKFSDMDHNHSGVITMEDFLKALDLPHTQDTEEVFQLFDKNGNGHINFREFLAGLAFVSKHTSFAQTIQAAFKACDSNGDDVLSRDEVARSLHNMFQELPELKISQLFDTLDLDHDGSISWEEFSNFLQRNPEYLAVIMAARPNLLKAPEES